MTRHKRAARRLAGQSVAFSAALWALSAAPAMAFATDLQTHHDFQIPAQSLDTALLAFSSQAKIQVLMWAGAHPEARSPGVSGDLTALAALKTLLANTGLQFKQIDPETVAIVAPADVSSQGSAAAAVAGSGTDQEGRVQLEEVLVTAKTGIQAVRTISGSATALTGDQLEALGAQSLEDYLTRTPGVVFNAGLPGLSSATIRGVSTTVGVNNGQGTTGYFINDVPLTDPFNSAGIPDVDAFDVSDVTVLRGPQGTLFGAASLGGAINYQAAQPNLSAYEAHLEGTVEGTQDGGVGGAGKLMINAPLINDVLGLRAVFVHRTDAGYIDNIGTGRNNSNQTTLNGGRFELAWQPFEGTRLNYLLLEQEEDTQDIGDQELLVAGPLKKQTLIPEPLDFRTTIHNLRLDQDLGFATLTATATYHEKLSSITFDYTAPSAPSFPGIDPVREREVLNTYGSTFEARLASKPGGRLDYLVGVYHDDTHENNNDTFVAANAAEVIENTYGPLFGAGIGAVTAPGGTIFQGTGPFRGQESALFGEATWHFNDSWKLTLGGRAFHTQSSSTETEQDFFELVNTGNLKDTLIGGQSQSSFAPKGSITWTPSEEFMAYALVSKGFRFGGPNISPSSAGFTIPPSFGTDSLVNYEIGERSTLFDRRLQLDAAVFYIDWSNIQLEFYSPAGVSYVTNASKAKNYGVEETLTWRIVSDLTFQTNLTYLQAVLNADYNPGGGQPVIPSGTTLPGASKWQTSNTLSYQWRAGPSQPTFALSERYISRAPGNLGGGVPQGDYGLLDARVTFHFGRFDLAAFGDNLCNSHGVTSGVATAGLPLQQYIVRPRTAGLTVDIKM